jgi:hypothetical protein
MRAIPALLTRFFGWSGTWPKAPSPAHVLPRLKLDSGRIGPTGRCPATGQ